MTVPATRQGEPAHLSAPPRYRASERKPFVPELERYTPTIIERLFGWKVKP